MTCCGDSVDMRGKNDESRIMPMDNLACMEEKRSEEIRQRKDKREREHSSGQKEGKFECCGSGKWLVARSCGHGNKHSASIMLEMSCLAQRL
jgi:hypothetical protein